MSERMIAPYSRSYERELEEENKRLRDRLETLEEIQTAAMELDAASIAWHEANNRLWSAVKDL